MHPIAIAGRRVLEQHPGRLDEVPGQALGILEDINELPDGFRVTSRDVATARRG